MNASCLAEMVAIRERDENAAAPTPVALGEGGCMRTSLALFSLLHFVLPDNGRYRTTSESILLKSGSVEVQFDIHFDKRAICMVKLFPKMICVTST